MNAFAQLSKLGLRTVVFGLLSLSLSTPAAGAHEADHACRALNNSSGPFKAASRFKSCWDKIWMTKQTDALSHPIFLINLETMEVEEIRGSKCQSMDYPSWISSDSASRKDIENMKGYAHWRDAHSSSVHLVFNFSFEDTLARLNRDSTNKLMQDYSAFVTTTCSSPDDSAFPMAAMKPWLSYGEYFGFFAHESMHPIQLTRWQRPPFKELGSITQIPQETANFYFERIEYYLARAIESALRNENPSESLGKVKLLYDEIERDHPSLLNLDNLNEGSATFVETRARALYESGSCTISKTELDKRQWLILKKLGSEHNSTGSSAYIWSAFSALLLEIQNDPNWREKVETGRTPLEIVLKDASPFSLTDAERLRGVNLAVCKAVAVNEYSKRVQDPRSKKETNR